MSSDNYKPSPSRSRLTSLDLCRIMSHHSASSSSAAEDEDTVMTYPDDADDEREEVSSVRYVGYADIEHEEEESDEEHADDEDDTDDQDEREVETGFFPYVLGSLQSGGPLYQQQYHSTTYPNLYQSIYHDDDDDISDDGGAPVPPVDYLSIANILTNDMDVEEEYYQPPYLEEDYAPPGDTGHPSNGGDEGYFNDDVEPIIEMTAEEAAADPDLVGGDELVAAMWGTLGAIPPPQAASITTVNAPEVQQQLGQLGAGDQFDDGSAVWFAAQDTGPAAFVNPNISTLSPGNYPLIAFLQSWAGAPPSQRLNKERWRFPWIKKIAEQASTHLTHVQYADLEGDQCDFQGIDWEDLGVSRREARERRLLTYTNYTNETGSDRWHVSTVQHSRRILGWRY
jgi:hypothetical protein